MLEKGNTDNEGAAGTGRKGYINCMKCEHFYITWEPKMPRACRVFGFKGVSMPSVAVFNVTRSKCPSFTPKQKRTGNAS